jgi:serine/threonine protein kinase
MTNRQGQQLDSYRLIRLLGAGSFGEVYLAQHVYRTSQAPVAIKVLSPLTQDDLQSFLGEARITRLKHPNIVQILDFGIDGRIPFIVMKYAPNGTLRQLHPKGSRVSLPTIVSYVKQLASALQYAHDERLIHRDIKPENMLVGEQNQILLSDFGVATIARSMQSQSVEQIVGTAAYMAPEQIQNHPHPASDQYSLGVVVYEWLCGERPFQGTFAEVAIKHTVVPPPPLYEKIPTIAPNVEQIVMKALAKDLKQRFDSVSAFATALEQAYANTFKHTIQSVQSEPFEHVAQSVQSEPFEHVMQSVQSEPFEHVTQSVQSEPVAIPASSPSQEQNTIPAIESARELTQPQIARRKIMLGLGTGLLVGAGSLTWLVLSHRLHIPSMLDPTPTPVPSPKPTPTPIPPGTLLYTYPGHNAFVNAVAWSPDGKRIASGSSDSTVQVWDAANGGNVYTYNRHSQSVVSVAWSSDGKRIASASFDKTVQVWDATNGSNVYTYTGHSQPVVSVVWSPDGKRVASASADKTVQVWDAADGGHVSIYNGHSKLVLSVAWSPDGKRIASASLDHTVQVWDAASGGGHVYIYNGHSQSVVSVAWSPDSKRIASASLDHTVQVWNAIDGSPTFTYGKHSDAVLAVTWSHNGKRIASGAGGNDHTVQVWDAADGSHAFTYHRHTSEVRAVAWSPDDRGIASASNDTTVQVWVAG